MILLLSAAMSAIFFSLTYFWIYPDSWCHGQNPRDWAFSGALMMILFNVVGLLLWIILYLDGRKRGPGYSLLKANPHHRSIDPNPMARHKI
jgi:hypothetical protein